MTKEVDEEVVDLTGEDSNLDDSDKNIKEEMSASRKKTFKFEGLIFLLALISFLLLGTIGGFWRWCWLMFLIAIVISSIFEALLSKRISYFNYPIAVTVVYLFLGLLGPQIWHPTWILFVSIPIFYMIANPLDNHFEKLRNIK